jgi:hypothetical protein
MAARLTIVLASRPIRIDEVKATLEGSDGVDAGAKFQVKWSGPDNSRDYVAIGNASAILGCVHYWWQVKADVREPLIYATVLLLLLG